MAALLLLVAAIFWFPRNGDDAASVSPTDGTGSDAASGASPSGEANDAAQAPVVVGHADTRANTWSAVLADPAVELGRPSEDEGTRGLISRALWEAQDDRANRSATDEALKLRARTEGDAAPVLAAPERLQQLADHPSPAAPASPENAAVAAGAASGGPQPNATVVTRAQWDEYHAQHPDTPLVASTPGDRPAADSPTVDDDALKQALGQWAHLAEPFHALVAIDVSGSMGAPVSPDGATRMDLTKAAATTAVTLFPEHDALGVWAFGHRLDGDKDYREITPVREMAAPVDGVTQRERLAGIGQADSVTIDFHKSWFQPVSCSAVIVRDPRTLRHCTHHADYLNPADTPEPNQVDRSLQTTRRFDALKLWTSLRAMGPERIGELFDSCCALAQETAREIEADPRFELLAQPSLSTVLFRWLPRDGSDPQALVRQVRRRVWDEASSTVAETVVGAQRCLKLTLLNPAAQLSDLRDVLDDVHRAGEAVLAERAPQPHPHMAETAERIR